jgi:O-antigen ligase
MATFFSIWQFGRMVLLFVAIGGEFHRRDAQRGLINGLALGLIFQSVYVVEQKLTGVVQAGGSVGHQNTLGLMVELVLMPLIASALAGNRSRVLIVGILAGLAIIGGGGSRATLGFAGAGIAILGILSLIRHTTARKIQVVLVGCVALAIAAPFGYMTLKERFGARSLVTSEDERAGFERAAMAISHDYPMGIGSNMYVTTATTQGYNMRAGVVWHTGAYSIPVHNAYLLARAETGFLGEITFILLLLVPILRGFIFAFKYRSAGRGEIVLGSSIGLSLNLLHNNYEFATLSATVLSLVMINLGIIAAEMRFAKFAPRPPRRRLKSDDRATDPDQAPAAGHQSEAGRHDSDRFLRDARRGI